MAYIERHRIYTGGDFVYAQEDNGFASDILEQDTDFAKRKSSPAFVPTKISQKKSKQTVRPQGLGKKIPKINIQRK